MAVKLGLHPNSDGTSMGFPHNEILDWRLATKATASRAVAWPQAHERSQWQNLLLHAWPQDHYRATRHRLQHFTNEPWPALPAHLLRRFAVDGNRSLFQQAYFARRERITDLALIQAMDDDHSVLDELVDGLWLLCEETSWCLPAHWHLAALPRRPIQALPPMTEQVDLFAAESAALLAMVCDLCGEALDTWSDQLIPHIRREVARRCITPVLTSDDWFWWDGHHNWSPWIAANLLSASSLLCAESTDDALLMDRLCGVLTRYLDHIPKDGYCDEGPSYWNAGTGMSVVALDLLYRRSDGAINAFKWPKLQAMGDYLNHTYLGHGRWITTADSKPRVQVHPEIPILLGQRCGLPALEARGWELHTTQGHQPISPLMGGGGLGPRLRRLWWLDHQHQSTLQLEEFTARPASQMTGPDTWFASGQLAVMRQQTQAGVGCSAAIKFGNNHENHNHLDVGQVMVQWDDLPLIVDPGVDTYRSDHFSPQRYTIPWVGAEAHNAPIISQQGQSPGTGFGYIAPEKLANLDLAARNVSYRSTPTACHAEGDLAPCYPQLPDLQYYQRRVTLERDHGGRVIIEDQLECDQALAVQIHWLSACEPHAITLQGWRWPSPQGDIIVLAHGVNDIQCHRVPLKDPQLRDGWGRQLWKITTTAAASINTTIRLQISRQGA